MLLEASYPQNSFKNSKIRFFFAENLISASAELFMNSQVEKIYCPKL
jgi:hypothetical protein